MRSMRVSRVFGQKQCDTASFRWWACVCKQDTRDTAPGPRNGVERVLCLCWESNRVPHSPVSIVSLVPSSFTLLNVFPRPVTGHRVRHVADWATNERSMLISFLAQFELTTLMVFTRVFYFLFHDVSIPEAFFSFTRNILDFPIASHTSERRCPTNGANSGFCWQHWIQSRGAAAFEEYQHTRHYITVTRWRPGCWCET
jgi:hypothetical protein